MVFRVWNREEDVGVLGVSGALDMSLLPVACGVAGVKFSSGWAVDRFPIEWRLGECFIRTELHSCCFVWVWVCVRI